ncbi:MAG TPA: SRPBCC domain-containing protein [Myxococcaceae bacterium]|nr:SRPBCC domain-containing protein [Myxococcaceae bacterium]
MSDPPKKPQRTLTLEARLPATPEQVSRMLTDPAELARWFAPYVDGSGRVGELLTLSWGPDVTWRTRVEAVEPGRLVRWCDAPADQQGGPPAGMVIEWTLGTESGGTRLRLVHSGFGEGGDWDEQYDGTEAGWSFFLWHLGETLRHHPGKPRVVVWERRASVLSREEIGARLFGPIGLALDPDRPQPGSVAHLRLAGSRRRFEVEHVRLPTHLWGRLPDLDGALLLAEMEPGRTGPVQTGLWLSTWGLDAASLDTVRTGLRSMADAVFSPPAG